MTKEQKEGWEKVAEIMEDYNLEVNVSIRVKNDRKQVIGFEITGSNGVMETDTLCADDIMFICNIS